LIFFILYFLNSNYRSPTTFSCFTLPQIQSLIVN